MATLFLRDIAKLPVQGTRVIATMGCFDGLHRGHQALLQVLKERKQALAVLKNACENTLENHKVDFMPALIDCARARSTVQEMADVMKSVFGWGTVY